MLAAILDKQLEKLNELLAVLRKEQDRLVARDDALESMEALVALKAEITASLESLEKERKAVLAKLGYGDDPEASVTASQAQGCLDQWTAVQDLCRQVAHHNEVNGSLIQLRMNHNSRLLEQLREMANERLYDAQGQPLKRSSRIETSA